MKQSPPADFVPVHAPDGPRHLKFSLPGVVALFGAGWLACVAFMGALTGLLLYAFGAVLLTGALLTVALLDASSPPARGWYARAPGSLFFRRVRG